MKTETRTPYMTRFLLCVAAVAALSLLPKFAFADSVSENEEAVTDGIVNVITEESSPEGVMPRNTIDRTLDLRLDKDTRYGTTIERKDGNSSVFVNVTARPNICMLYTDGFTDGYGSNRRNCTNHGGATLQSYGKFEIYNQVNEWGYTHVQVTALRTGNAYAVKGKWSPDYSYEAGVGVLNP